MGRKRKNSADNWMPAGVRPDAKGNRYILRSKVTNGKEIRLCALSATRSQVWAAYEALLIDEESKDNIGYLITAYFKSTKFKSLAPRTQDDYHDYYKALKNITFNDGAINLIELKPQQLTKGIVKQILNKRAEQGAAVQGNRAVKGLLSAVYTWALELDMIPGMQANPCHGVKRNKETGDKRYIEDDDYYYALNHADQVPAYVGIAMELCYLLFNRIAETLKLKRADLLPEGVYVGRLKGSKHNIVGWSPRLEDAINKSLTGKVKSMYLVHDEKGQPVKYWTLRKHWDLLMNYCEKQAEKDGITFNRFNRHQLKAKGISDRPDQNSAGHKSEKVRQDYIRKPEVVKPAK